MVSFRLLARILPVEGTSQSPNQAAVETGNRDGVNLLLDSGASIDTPGPRWGLVIPALQPFSELYQF